MATVQPVRLVPVVPAYKDVALTGVYEISKILTTPQALDRCLGGVIAVLSSFMQMRRGYILVLDDSGEPELTAAMGEGDRKPARARSLVPSRSPTRSFAIVQAANPSLEWCGVKGRR